MLKRRISMSVHDGVEVISLLFVPPRRAGASLPPVYGDLQGEQRHGRGRAHSGIHEAPVTALLGLPGLLGSQAGQPCLWRHD